MYSSAHEITSKNKQHKFNFTGRQSFNLLLKLITFISKIGSQILGSREFFTDGKKFFKYMLFLEIFDISGYNQVIYSLKFMNEKSLYCHKHFFISGDFSQFTDSLILDLLHFPNTWSGKVRVPSSVLKNSVRKNLLFSHALSTRGCLSNKFFEGLSASLRENSLVLSELFFYTALLGCHFLARSMVSLMNRLLVLKMKPSSFN